ncbi:MAG: Ig-like domain-containing protein [Aquabacterium sp.]|nr:Ig-like domain-containing protein [Ferruginibacter sp.]
MTSKNNLLFALCITACLCTGCNKTDTPPPPPPIVTPETFDFKELKINNATQSAPVYNVALSPALKLTFTANVNRTTVGGGITLKNNSGADVAFTATYENGDSTVLLQPVLAPLTKYFVTIGNGLKTQRNTVLSNSYSLALFTQIDSAAKFPVIADNALLDLVQKQTFKYFWDFGHPVSGLARERNNGDNNLVTSGGSGFGIMAIVTGISRNFITRGEGLSRMQTITAFLKNTAQTFKGAFPHWLNGTTGAVIPFSTKDDGADLVETSYLVQGLLCARQYFNGAGASETSLRNDINTICDRVEWDWFRKSNENVLYWHWSPTYNWDINQKIQGWNESMITYILAASSAAHGVPATVYTGGWAANGTNGFINGNAYYGYTLPLGPPRGGPLFFSHYSFMGINPNGLTDLYANYTTQTKNHTLINYSYCIANPNNFYGYSDQCWGLTASDVPNGYTASSPTNDVGVIAPTAAISSLPYTPAESMKALKFFYYTLGDKLWKEYGFVDAFALKDLWYANSFLAIDEGPVIVMIENYRSGLLWNLLTGCPEVKAGMKKLGFTAPYL